MIDILFLLVACASAFTLVFALVTENKNAIEGGMFGLCAVLVVGALYYGISGRVGFEWAL